MNKFVEPRPYADPDVAARKLVELANAHEPYMDGRILIERLNGAMLYQHKATPAEYKAGLDLAIERGWLELHESGNFVSFTRSGRICSLRNQPEDTSLNLARPSRPYWSARQCAAYVQPHTHDANRGHSDKEWWRLYLGPGS